MNSFQAKAVTLTVYNAFKLAENGWAEKQASKNQEKENHHMVKCRTAYMFRGVVLVGQEIGNTKT